jgi:integrase
LNRKLPPNIYQRQYKTRGGYKRTLYYVQFVDCREIRRTFPAGDDFVEAKKKRDHYIALNNDGHDFDSDRQKGVLTFKEWAKLYPQQEGVKDKPSLPTQLTLINCHLRPFFDGMLLTEFARPALIRYIDKRMGQTLIRGSKHGKVPVKRGTISNELSLVRRMLNVAKREGHDISMPSFEGLIVRTNRGGRALGIDEQKKALNHMPIWLQRLAEFAKETCLSEGDILRLTPEMVDHAQGVIKPEGGRLKTGPNQPAELQQMAPLTRRARQILNAIERDKRKGVIVSNTNRVIFTREDGKKISRDMISRGITRAWKAAGIKKFVFHNYRNTALTEWVRLGIHVDVAMRASGHTSVQMHKRYLELQAEDISKAFETPTQRRHSADIAKRATGSNPVSG